MSLPVAVQVYSVRDSAEANLADTLRKIKEMGYAVEDSAQGPKLKKL